MNIALESNLAKLPIIKIQTSIQSHTEALMELLPDKRMKKVLEAHVARNFRWADAAHYRHGTSERENRRRNVGSREKHISVIGKQAFGNESNVSGLTD